MAGKGTLTVRVVGDTSDFRRKMDDIQGRIGKVAGGIANVGKVVAIGTGAAAAGAFALGREVLNTGGQLTSWRQKTATVFEGSADDIRKWADKNNEVFGLTDDQLAGLTANFGDLLKPMGFTADQAADMAKDVVGLSGALSEWSGGQRTAAEVSAILSKAMLGEREGLKELGISITEADVKARLLEKGQQDLTGAAEQQAKALATQELIFEKSTDAQAAFAEGGNKALRAQNNLKAGLGELREQISDRLLPVVTTVTQWLADNLPPAMERAGEIATALKEKWDEVFPAVQAVVETFRDVVVTVVETIVGLFKGSEESVGGSASKLGEIVTALKDMFASAFGAIRAIVETVVKVLTEAWDRFGRGLVDNFKRQWENLQGVFAGVVEVLTGIFDLIKAILTGKWGEAWDAIVQILSGAWEVIEGIVRAAIEGVRGLIETAMGTISGIWSALWNGIKTLVSDVWEGIKGGVSSGVDAVVGFVAAIPGRITSAVSGGFDALKDAFRSAVNWIIDKWNNLRVPGIKIGGWDPPGPGPKFPSFTTPAVSLPNLPRLHDGGVFRTSAPGGEGLAILKDGETVLPTHKTGPRPMAPVINLYLTNSGVIGSQRELDDWLVSSLIRVARRNGSLFGGQISL